MEIEKWRYENYQSLSHYAYSEYCYPEFVSYKDQQIKSIAKKLTEAYTNPEEEANYILSFVQNLPYKSENGQYVSYPIQTLVNGGDCEDFAILYGALMKTLGYEVGLIHPPDHLLAGIHLPQKPEGGKQNKIYFLKDNGKKYYSCPATAKGYNLGDLPPEYQNKSAFIMIIT